MNLLFIVMNILSGVLMIALTSNQTLPIVKISTLTKAGLWVGGIGLIAQSLRTGYMEFYDVFPFQDLPIWMLKDVGYWLIASGLFIHILKGNKID